MYANNQAPSTYRDMQCEEDQSRVITTPADVNARGIDEVTATLPKRHSMKVAYELWDKAVKAPVPKDLYKQMVEDEDYPDLEEPTLFYGDVDNTRTPGGMSSWQNYVIYNPSELAYQWDMEIRKRLDRLPIPQGMADSWISLAKICFYALVSLRHVRLQLLDFYGAAADNHYLLFQKLYIAAAVLEATMVNMQVLELAKDDPRRKKSASTPQSDAIRDLKIYYGKIVQLKSRYESFCERSSKLVEELGIVVRHIHNMETNVSIHWFYLHEQLDVIHHYELTPESKKAKGILLHGKLYQEAWANLDKLVITVNQNLAKLLGHDKSKLLQWGETIQSLVSINFRAIETEQKHAPPKKPAKGTLQCSFEPKVLPVLSGVVRTDSQTNPSAAMDIPTFKAWSKPSLTAYKVGLQRPAIPGRDPSVWIDFCIMFPEHVGHIIRNSRTRVRSNQQTPGAFVKGLMGFLGDIAGIPSHRERKTSTTTSVEDFAGSSSMAAEQKFLEAEHRRALEETTTSTFLQTSERRRNVELAEQLAITRNAEMHARLDHSSDPLHAILHRTFDQIEKALKLDKAEQEADNLKKQQARKKRSSPTPNGSSLPGELESFPSSFDQRMRGFQPPELDPEITRFYEAAEAAEPTPAVLDQASSCSELLKGPPDASIELEEELRFQPEIIVIDQGSSVVVEGAHDKAAGYGCDLLHCNIVPVLKNKMDEGKKWIRDAVSTVQNNAAEAACSGLMAMGTAHKMAFEGAVHVIEKLAGVDHAARQDAINDQIIVSGKCLKQFRKDPIGAPLPMDMDAVRGACICGCDGLNVGQTTGLIRLGEIKEVGAQDDSPSNTIEECVWFNDSVGFVPKRALPKASSWKKGEQTNSGLECSMSVRQLRWFRQKHNLPWVDGIEPTGSTYIGDPNMGYAVPYSRYQQFPPDNQKEVNKEKAIQETIENSKRMSPLVPELPKNHAKKPDSLSRSMMANYKLNSKVYEMQQKVTEGCKMQGIAPMMLQERMEVQQASGSPPRPNSVQIPRGLTGTAEEYAYGREVLDQLDAMSIPRYKVVVNDDGALQSVMRPEEPKFAYAPAVVETAPKPAEAQSTADFPRFGLTAESPKFGLTTDSPRFGLTAESPKFGLTTDSPKFGLTAESPKFGLTTDSPKFGLTADSPRFGPSSDDQPQPATQAPPAKEWRKPPLSPYIPVKKRPSNTRYNPAKMNRPDYDQPASGPHPANQLHPQYQQMPPQYQPHPHYQQMPPQYQPHPHYQQMPPQYQPGPHYQQMPPQYQLDPQMFYQMPGSPQYLPVQHFAPQPQPHMLPPNYQPTHADYPPSGPMMFGPTVLSPPHPGADPRFGYAPSPTMGKHHNKHHASNGRRIPNQSYGKEHYKT